MALNVGFTTIGNNLGFAIELVALFIIMTGSLIFYAKNATLGIIIGFMLAVLTFMGTYALDLNWVPALIVSFIMLVMLSFSLYTTGRNSAVGGLT